jgi:hypothetical protein
LNSDEPKKSTGPTDSRQMILQEVQQVYDWLAGQITAMNPSCRACGTCCDFDAYGHRLYVTTPEMLYFLNRIEQEMRFMTEGVCPYREDGRCGARDSRFSACRIFYCTGDTRRQYELSEEAVRRFRKICEQYDLPYRYIDLKYALSHPDLWFG